MSHLICVICTIFTNKDTISVKLLEHFGTLTIHKDRVISYGEVHSVILKRLFKIYFEQYCANMRMRHFYLCEILFSHAVLQILDPTRFVFGLSRVFMWVENLQPCTHDIAIFNQCSHLSSLNNSTFQSAEPRNDSGLLEFDRQNRRLAVEGNCFGK